MLRDRSWGWWWMRCAQRPREKPPWAPKGSCFLVVGGLLAFPETRGPHAAFAGGTQAQPTTI
ncbi:hypothetical protein MIC448_1360002 [Microbacterium sp. C448]|nr:hypothetical protein MIC448_1360002 [Microbacterium sp. C448]